VRIGGSAGIPADAKGGVTNGQDVRVTGFMKPIATLMKPLRSVDLNTLTDAQAKDIYAYIRTFKSNAPELKDIPTLNAIIASANRPYKK